MHLHGEEAGAAPPAASELARLLAEADEILKISPPTDFALVSVAAHALSQRPSRAEASGAPMRLPASVHASPPPSSRSASSTAVPTTSAAEQKSHQTVTDTSVATPHPIVSSQTQEQALPLLGTVISLASCLKLPDHRPAESSSATADVSSIAGVARSGLMSPRSAAAAAATICERYKPIIDAAVGRREGHLLNASNAKALMPASPDPPPQGEASPGAGDSSSTGGSGNVGARSRNALGNNPAGAEADFAADVVTNIFEKYQGIIDASGINPSVGLRSCKASTGGCKIPGLEQQLSHSSIDAGSGGTADALAAEQGSAMESMCENLLGELTTVVDSGGSGDTCGCEGGAGPDKLCADAQRDTAAKDGDSSIQVSACDVVKVDELGLSSVPQAAQPAKMPWTFTYFFDDEGLQT